jgi:hypothetical protein
MPPVGKESAKRTSAQYTCTKAQTVALAKVEVRNMEPKQRCIELALRTAITPPAYRCRAQGHDASQRLTRFQEDWLSNMRIPVIPLYSVRVQRRLPKS